MSDIGKRFGRGLNESIVPEKSREKEATGGIDLHDGVEQFKLKLDAKQK